MGGKHLNLTRLLNSIILHPRLRWYWCVSDCNNLTSFFAFSCGAKHSHWVFLRHWRVFVSLLRIHPVDEVQRTSKRQGDRETESISKKKVLWASLFAAGRKYSKFCYVWVGVCLFYHQTKRKYLVHMWKKDCVNAWKRSHSISATVCARQCSFRFDFTGAAVVDGISFSTIFFPPHTHTHFKQCAWFCSTAWFMSNICTMPGLRALVQIRRRKCVRVLSVFWASWELLLCHSSCVFVVRRSRLHFTWWTIFPSGLCFISARSNFYLHFTSNIFYMLQQFISSGKPKKRA